MGKANYKIITCGLGQEEINLIKMNIPKKEYEVQEYETVTDLLSHDGSIYIIHADTLNGDEKELLLSFYEEIDGCTDETIFLLGNFPISNALKNYFLCYESFDEFKKNISYHLLTAHTKSKKARDFSEKLADCIVILSMIRNKPGIKTQEMANKLERSTRTVLRYIATLRAAGEWIMYDTEKKGWHLDCDTSQLFEVYFARGE